MQVPSDDGPSFDGHINIHVYDNASDDSADIVHGANDNGNKVQGKQVRERLGVW